MHLLTCIFLSFTFFTLSNALPVVAREPEPELQGKELEEALKFLNAPEPWESSAIPPEILQRIWG